MTRGLLDACYGEVLAVSSIRDELDLLVDELQVGWRQAIHRHGRVLARVLQQAHVVDGDFH